ncbi:MAG TPA: glycosyltransferase family 4 protein [Anaerolineae bacterium]|nr:glycosyltransferase family 4 protein [Anaerolineae bacterium]
MNLLFLTPQSPYPPHKGTTLRNYNLIAGLAARHAIDVLTFADAEQAAAARSSPLAELCRRIDSVPPPARSMLARALTTLGSPLPDMALRLWSPHFAERLTAWLRERSYDIIQIEAIEMARYGLLARQAAPRSQLVFDDHNAEWLLQRRTYEAERQLHGWSIGALYSLIQSWKLKRYERSICRAADRVLAVSAADAAAIRQLDPRLQPTVVTNGVDTQHYRPGAVAPIDFGAPALVFSGTMDFRPNVDAALWFAERVLPKVHASIPAATFVIVGQRPHARLDVLRGRADVRITGAVDDVRPYIAGATVYVAPLRMGGGTRLKVLEALALGAPIVSTSMGVDGFDVAHEREVVIADDPDRFAAEVVRTIEDADRRRVLRECGRRYVEAAYDWKAIVPKLEEVYRLLNG